MGSPMNQSGDILENLVRESTFIVQRVIGGDREVVSGSAAESRERISQEILRNVSVKTDRRELPGRNNRSPLQQVRLENHPPPAFPATRQQ